MSLRGGVLLFPTKQSPVLRDVLVENEIASPPKTKSGGSQRHDLARCMVANLLPQRLALTVRLSLTVSK